MKKSKFLIIMLTLAICVAIAVCGFASAEELAKSPANATGKNLFDYDYLMENNLIIELEAGTYTFSSFTIATHGFNISISGSDTDDFGSPSQTTYFSETLYATMGPDQNGGYVYATFTFPTDGYLYISLNGPSDEEVLADFTKLQLERGSAITAYEPYTNEPVEEDPDEDPAEDPAEDGPNFFDDVKADIDAIFADYDLTTSKVIAYVVIVAFLVAVFRIIKRK